MGKKNKRHSKVNGVAAAPVEAVETRDPWASIENGDHAPPAFTLKKKENVEKVEELPKINHYEKFKNKKKRRCDGSSAAMLDMHQHDDVETLNLKKEAKRARLELSDVTSQQNENLNVFASLAKKRSQPETSVAEKLKKSSQPDVIVVENGHSETSKPQKKTKNKKNKKASKQHDEVPYIVEEPTDEVAIPQKAKMVVQQSVDDEDNLSGLDSDGDNEMEFENIMRVMTGFGRDDDDKIRTRSRVMDESLVELDDEEEDELSDEEVEIEDEMEDEEGEELDDEAMEDEDTTDVEDEDDIEFLNDEEEVEGEMDSDEESIVSEQDAASDEEACLGELRPCATIEHKKKYKSRVSVDFDAFPFNNDDSSVTASRAFGWIIHSCDVQTFFSEYYQQRALVVKRNTPDYYGNLFSSQRLSEMLSNNHLEYGMNVNIATYKNSVRYTMNGKGRVYPQNVAEHLSIGRSVQVVNPQSFDDRIWYLCDAIQELYGCFVGANTYLTPAGSAGFAPHWDEIDAFLLQLEGKKYWKVYAPRTNDEELPLESSGNFTEEDMKRRKPAFEGWIEAGDLLYIPRGFIHQAITDKKAHSLHVTISTGRHWSFADVLNKIIPESVEALVSQRKKLRQSLPIGLLDMGGVLDMDYTQAESFIEKYGVAMDRHMAMLRNFVADHSTQASIDIMAKEFMKTALPPCISPEEKALTSANAINLLDGSFVDFMNSYEVKFLRRHGQRLLIDSSDECSIATRINNSKIYEGLPERVIDFPIEYEDMFIHLANAYPEWTRSSELPKNFTRIDKAKFFALLYKYGLIMARPFGKKSKK